MAFDYDVMPRPYKYHISFFSWDKNGNMEIGEIYTNVRERLNTQNNIQKWQKEFIKEKDKKNIVIININRLKR